MTKRPSDTDLIALMPDAVVWCATCRREMSAVHESAAEREAARITRCTCKDEQVQPIIAASFKIPEGFRP